MSSPRRVGKSLLAFSLVGLTAVAAACGTTSETEPPARTCSEDADCDPAEQCQHASSLTQPIAFNPCATVQGCVDASACGPALVCAPYEPPNPVPAFSCPAKTCQAPCTPDSCASGEVCGDDGVCRYLRCDENGAPACPARYRCDPAAATTSRPGLVVNGASSPEVEDPQLAAQRGCVRMLCDEEGGFACLDTWSCDPARAGDEGSGCVPKPCTETGRCRDDATFICEPDGDERRPQGKDVHGCVYRNCAEGRACSFVLDDVNYAYCDVRSPAADDFGCVVRQCDELPELCADNYVCDVAARPGTKNAFGCRVRGCNEPGGPTCEPGQVCSVNAAGFPYCAVTGGSGGAAGSAGGGGDSARPGGSAGASAGTNNAGRASGGSAGATATVGGRAASGGADSTGGVGARTQPASGICVNRP